MNAYMPYILCLILFCIGIYAVLSKRNIIKIILGVVIAEYAVNLFLILVAYKAGGRAAIFSSTQEIAPGSMVDPLPHALVLTSIVIGLATTAFLIALAIRLYGKYGTFDITRMRELRG
ncbi:MAG: sodium:proton antiporter [Candidatus Aegiribacteria sp.]